jgi:FtsP/CotA-like multicopper oxidase with cupredoxin domain
VIGALAGALILAVALFLVLPIQPPYVPPKSATSLNPIPNVNVILYAGEISDAQYGFGTEPNNLTIPGPTLRFKTTDWVNLTIINQGAKPHAFQMTNAPREGASVVFNAFVASTNNPLQTGQTASVIFNSNIAGEFYYISPVSGQTEMGMWGSVIIAQSQSG